MRQALRQPYKQFFGTLANQARIDIIEILRQEPLTINEISAAANMEQSHISHNIKRLVECGFVTTETNGREKLCKLNEETIKPLLALMDHHMEHHCCHVVEQKEGKRPKLEKVKTCH